MITYINYLKTTCVSYNINNCKSEHLILYFLKSDRIPAISVNEYNKINCTNHKMYWIKYEIFNISVIITCQGGSLALT